MKATGYIDLCERRDNHTTHTGPEMISYKELLAQKAALEQQIEQARAIEVSAAVNTVKQLVADFGLTADEVFNVSGKKSGPGSTKGTKVAAKYKNLETGETWTGRGKAPRWLDGKDRKHFLINTQALVA